MADVHLIDEERPFALDELFISVTDAKGHIRLGNDVFVRISGHPEEELVGAAHNIIRHPDMPRAVFALMWDELHAGRTFAGYVKNRAADGRHYWVLAVVAPAEGGYVSVRMKPSTPYFDAARTLYAELLETERRHEGGDVRRRKSAIAASGARMGELLAAAGFPSYDAFAHAALPAEVQARLAALPPRADDGDRGDGAAAACSAARRSLGRLLTDVGGFADVSRDLAGGARVVADHAEDVRIDALNGVIAAARLTDGRVLGAIAGLMRGSAHRTGAMTGRLLDGMDRTSADVADMGYRIAAADLQLEMMAVFAGGAARSPEELRTFLPVLAGAALQAVDHVCDRLPRLEQELAELAGLADLLRRELATARTLVMNGRIEVSRSAEMSGAQHVFTAIGERVAASERELVAFGRIADLNGTGGAVARQARADAAHLHAAVEAL